MFASSWPTRVQFNLNISFSNVRNNRVILDSSPYRLALCNSRFELIDTSIIILTIVVKSAEFCSAVQEILNAILNALILYAQIEELDSKLL